MKELLWISACVWLFVCCQKSEIKDFSSEDSAVYFQMETGKTLGNGSLIYAPTHLYTDSSIVSFVGQKTLVGSLKASIPIVTMGDLQDYKRPVRVVVDEERTTAVRGVDFEVNLDTVAIPANAAKGYLVVKLLRTDALLKESKRVAFRLEENEYFKLHVRQLKASTNWASSARILNTLSYAVIFHEQYKEPDYYTSYGKSFWGPWTPKKYIVINEVMQWTDADWDRGGESGTKVVYGRFDFAAKATRRYLQEMADAKTPVIDSDGTYMQLATKYAVDYSKLEDKED